MPGAARLGDLAACPMDAHGCLACFHGVRGPVVQGSNDVFINGKPAAHVGCRGIHGVCCGPNTFTIADGAPSVFINGYPAARIGDRTAHCGGSGEIKTGSSDVIIGNGQAQLFANAAKSHAPFVDNIAANRKRSNQRLQKDVQYLHEKGISWADDSSTLPEDIVQRNALSGQTYKPPAGLNDAIERLGEARKRLASEGFKPKYTDDQLKAMAAKGEVNDRFIVRFIECKYAKSDVFLGPMNDGKVRYWSTTFDQIENADTDPKRIAESLGQDYDPSKEYKLAVIDTADAAKYGDSHTIIPTHEKLGKFAQKQLENKVDPNNIPKVLNNGYADEYARAMEAAKKDGVDFKDAKDYKDFTGQYFKDSESRELFKTRATIHNELGANEYFTGNGLTAYTGKECDNAYGTVETFTFDKNPQTIGDMMSGGRMKLLNTSPVKRKGQCND